MSRTMRDLLDCVSKVQAARASAEVRYGSQLWFSLLRADTELTEAYVMACEENEGREGLGREPFPAA